MNRESDIKGQWALLKAADETAIYGRPEGIEICWYCGGSLDGLNLFHQIDSAAWHLRCVCRELERRRFNGHGRA